MVNHEWISRGQVDVFVKCLKAVPMYRLLITNHGLRTQSTNHIALKVELPLSVEKV